MMNKLTGDLRNIQPREQPQQEVRGAGSRDSARGGQPPMPGNPQLHAAHACTSPTAAWPGSQLDHAPSMALIPSSKALAVPASLTDEALPTLQPLPGVESIHIQILPCHLCHEGDERYLQNRCFVAMSARVI